MSSVIILTIMTTEFTNAVATVAEKAQKTLATTVGTLQKTLTEVAAATAHMEEVIERVQVSENKLQSLDKEFSYRYRDQEAELALRVKENAKNVMLFLVEQADMVAVPTAEFTKLVQNLEAATANTDKLVKTAVEQASSMIHSRHHVEMTQLKASQSVDLASTHADLAAIQKQNAFLNEQVRELRAQVEADRNARIEIAKADASRAAVTVNNTK